MSMPARALPTPSRRPAETDPSRHLEIAPSRAQRRGRPRLVHVVVTLAGIGTILLAQLLLSFALADGAYKITGLQVEQRDLLREQQALTETLEIRTSTQNLTANAEQLGMVASGNPMFLDLASGAVSGSATAGGGSLVGGQNLIGNSLLDGSTTIDAAALAAAQAAAQETPETGESSIEGGVPSTVTETGTLPSPTTH